MEYGYARVSTASQNVDRQLDALHLAGIRDREIYIDKESGKDFDRTNYVRLKGKLKKGDVLFIKSIDRLGRNNAMILEEWRILTKQKAVDIVVLDMPLLDTRIEGQNLVGKFIADVVLQVLSFVAENERTTMRQRQAEGIRMAKLRGVRFGRPRIPNPENLLEIIESYRNGDLAGRDAWVLSGLSRGTFFRRVKELCQ